jgi:hypothetical protein
MTVCERIEGNISFEWNLSLLEIIVRIGIQTKNANGVITVHPLKWF